MSPKEDFALVTSARRIDPADPTRQIPDDRVSVIDLTPLQPGLLRRLGSAVGVSKGPAPMPKVVATLQAGMGASGVSINKAGTLALVANRDEGTVSIFAINGSTVTPAGKVTVGGDKSGPSHVVFSLDGKHAFVTRDGDHRIVVLSVDGIKVEVTKREMAAGLRPYAIDVAAKSAIAVVSNLGAGLGDADTISVIDLKADPMRVVNTVTVGQSPQGMKISPGRQVCGRGPRQRLRTGPSIRRSTMPTACCRSGRGTVRSSRRPPKLPSASGARGWRGPATAGPCSCNARPTRRSASSASPG